MISRNRDGDVCFTIDDRDELVSSLKEVLTSTDIGRNYKTDYYTKDHADEDAALIVGAAQQVAGGPNISLRNLEHALTLLIDSGELKAKNLTQAVPLEEPEVDNRPRGRDGKLLTASQLKWQEYRTWSENSNSEERKRRMASDPDYASFVRQSLRAEMAVEIDGSVVPVGQPTTKTRASKEIVDFAQQFLVEPRYNLKPKNGMVTLAGKQMTWPSFQELLNKATAAGVI